MSKGFIDIAYKTGAGRYIQQKDALDLLGSEACKQGSKCLVIAGPHALDTAGDAVKTSLATAQLPTVIQTYDGPTSYEAATRIGKAGRENGCDVVIGLDGGRIMDLAKVVAYQNNWPLIEVPTSSATCAAFTPLSVMYHEDGTSYEALRYEREIDAVIVDTTVLAQQPARLLAAGMLDAMAKSLEITNGYTTLSSRTESIQRYSAYAYAHSNTEILFENARKAYADVKDTVYTDAVERVTFTSLALTGIVSALTRGFHQTALAHRLYDGLRSIYPRESAPWLHGELVAIGLLMQATFNTMPAVRNDLEQLMSDLHMPTRLSHIGITTTDKRMNALQTCIEESEFVAQSTEIQKRFRAAFESIQ